MLFPISVCFSWLKALAASEVSLQTECSVDETQSISLLSSFGATRQNYPWKVLKDPLRQEKE